jgi:hypothetical protein
VNYKKQTESVIINLFREHYAAFPKGSLKPSESPDFILSISPSQNIGIELTRLHPYYSGIELLSYENITACLEAKNDKLRLYRKKKLNEYWLVISVNDLRSWNRINVHNKLMVWNFKTGFNRVFLFNTIDGKVLDLNNA